jgi:predicted ABC-type ATPase
MRPLAWPMHGGGTWWLGASRSAWRRSSPIPQGAKLDFLKECQSEGYTVLLVFIGLETADLSRGRVMGRVEAGGHDVPDEKIQSRFSRTFANLRQALRFVDEALLFDNSSSDQPYRFVAAFRKGRRQRRKGCEPAWAEPLLD